MKSKKAVLQTPRHGSICNIFYFHSLHTLQWMLTSFPCVHISHCCQAGKKTWMKLLWSLCGMFLKILRVSSHTEQTEKSHVWHSSLLAHTSCCPQTSPSGWPAQILSKCFCISSLPFYRSSVFTAFQPFTFHFQKLSLLPRSQLLSIMQNWKAKFRRLEQDSSSHHPHVECQTSRVTAFPHLPYLGELCTATLNARFWVSSLVEVLCWNLCVGILTQQY